MNIEIGRIIIDEGQFTEADYPFTIKPMFATLGSIIENSTQGPLFSFSSSDNKRHLLGFKGTALYEECNLLPNPVDILSSDNIFSEWEIAQGKIFKGRRSAINHNFTMDLDPGYKNIDKLRGGAQWYLMESINIISTVCFNLRKENNELVSFNGKSITFRISIKEV